MLTINERKNRKDLMEIVSKAFDYFPEGKWEGVKFLGNINMEHDLKVNSKEEVHGAFIFNNLLIKIREIKKMLRIEDLLLALTFDPVLMVYHRLVSDGFRRIVNLVRDYVSKDVGMISLFEIDEKTGVKIAAHGLGHNQGLIHHEEPIDLMYVGLLNGSQIRKNGFCYDCQKKLERTVV